MAGQSDDEIEIHYFKRATLYARKIDKKRYTVRITCGDRGQVAKVENGHIVIERKWYPT